MKYFTYIFFCLLIARSFSQTITKNYYFSGDKSLGLEKSVQVLVKDTNIYNGKYFHFFQSGGLRIDGQFKLNKPVGQWLYYFESGIVKQDINYRNDSTRYIKYFYENGTVKKEGK